MKRQLEMLPIGLDETYIRIFQKISRLPQTSRKLAQRCFLWAMYAKAPLDEPAFLDGVSVDQKTQKDGTPNYICSDVYAVTFGLLELHWIYDPISVTHFTVHSFFTDPPPGIPPECAALIPTAEEAHAQMAIMCLKHLLADNPSENFFGNCLFYCGRHFDAHIRHLKEIPEELLALLDDLFWKNPDKLPRIMAWRWPEGDMDDFPNFNCIGGVKSIDVNLFLRCTELDRIPAIWSRYASSESRTEPYPEEYIYIAAGEGLEDIVKALIAQGVDVNRVTRDGLTPLHLACGSNRIGVIKILLEAGADWKLDASRVPSEVQKKYSPPICATYCEGVEPAVREYFIRREDFSLAVLVRCLPKSDAYPINVQAFIDCGADINQRDDQGKTALEVARELGYDKLVEYLEALGHE